MFLRNIDYLMDFVRKHGYNDKITAGYSGGNSSDHITYVIFDKKDIPSGKKILIEDIRYDIDTELPPDVFFRWLEYCETQDEDNQPTYIYWMTKMPNIYETIGLDKSGSEELKQKLESAVNLIRNKLHDYRTQFGTNNNYKKNG